MNRRVLALALVLLLPALGLLAKDAGFAWGPAEEKEIAKREKKADSVHALDLDWTHVPGRTYEVHSEVDARFTAELSVFLDTFHDAFEKIWKSPVLVAKRPEVFVYSSQERFEARLKSKARGWYRCRWEGDGSFSEHALYSYAASAAEKDFTHF
jgi:hypothetical protein